MEFWNTFSLWVVLGSPISFLFFSSVFNTRFDYLATLCLTVTVWGIYTLDHILDGYKRKEYSLTLRHYIHYRYRAVLLALVTSGFVVVLFIAFFYLHERTAAFGLKISLGILIYYFLNQWVQSKWNYNLPLKEIGIACVVTLCFVYLPNIYGHVMYHELVLWLAVCMGAMNLSNLFMFSYYDYELDQRAKFGSISELLSKKQLGAVVWFCIAVSAISLGFIYAQYNLNPFAVGILLFMLLQLMMVFAFKGYFGKYERYRFWGDLIYVFPVLYFLWA